MTSRTWPDGPVFVAGHRGLVGSALVRELRRRGANEPLTATRSELDLRNQQQVLEWFEKYRPNYVLLVAGTVGGIMANSTRQGEFLYDNLMIHATVIEAARQTGVQKLLYLGSSCVYPRNAPQPISEESLLDGPLEPTNEGYAVAKISGIKLCQFYRQQYGCDFITAMPTNLYGPNDNFNLHSSHVLPALMRKFHEAKLAGSKAVPIWGSGTPKREFLHVDDLASACLHLMEHHDDDRLVNVGTGKDLSIKQLAETIRDVVYPEAELAFDTSKPDGMPRKVLDVSRLEALGWRSSIELRDGVADTYKWYLANEHELRGGSH